MQDRSRKRESDLTENAPHLKRSRDEEHTKGTVQLCSRDKVCFPYQKGNCSRGLSCRFSRVKGEKKSDHEDPQWGRPADNKSKENAKSKEKANFALSGALNEDINTGKLYRGVVLKWSEPPEARVPRMKWRLYVFKKKELLDTFYLHRQSAYLFGREKKIADVLTEHPSCSKQHAVLQFKLKAYRNDPASINETKKKIRPYILDLKSTNGTWLNGEKLEASRYIELMDKDVLKFGESSREYVLMSDDALANE